MSKNVKTIIGLTLLAQTTIASAGNYCTGIRGNGELAPAHWSALSKIVEYKGMPSTVAGGSSAAITQFLMDGISRNEFVDSQSTSEKQAQQALMFKTLVPHIMYLVKEDAKSPTIMRLVGNITGLTDGGFISALRKAVRIAKDLPTFFDVLGEYGPLLNPTLAAGRRRNFDFYKGQIAEGIKVFGGFDAKNDMNLFYREGLVDFKYVAIILGRLADFYAGYGHADANSKLQTFLSDCSDASRGKLWSELMVSNPECGEKLNIALDSYYELHWPLKQELGELDLDEDRLIRKKFIKSESFPIKWFLKKSARDLILFQRLR